MLKKIPAIIPPELMKIMMEMGHGNEIIFADGNFPAADYAQRLVRCDGHTVTELLEAILPFFPLDTYAKAPVGLMQVVPGDKVVPTIWDDYKAIITKHEGKLPEIDYVERFEFYERAKKAYAIVATSESALYANLILKKGVVVE
ncbi:L-fucose mutarotase [Sporanaerobium hydrogeniformans]|uniref:L-fucose mutarotase n=1 Tax=Sporanaerobium hydrogeniformans TaxID=3072179 RepID=A0AC61DH90_9FIRM|nr:L-fucose mutarotase [Sporanaerobium hydrogeniformans]PHV72143.1 L-fucose mutarotase [Sporanaerobium hydrogeniformans]